LATIANQCKRPGNIFLAVFVSVVYMYIALWISVWDTLVVLASLPDRPWGLICSYMLKAILLIQSNMGLGGAALLIGTALLTGLQVMLLVVYLKKRIAFAGAAASTSFFALIASTLGMGCSSCGSVLFPIILGSASVSGSAVHVLPISGFLLQAIAIGLLLGSMWYLAKKIQEPIVCDSSVRRS
jgi:hypothetical protein